MVTTLLEAIGIPQPFHFYGHTAMSHHALRDKSYQIETMRFWYLITPATGARAQELIDTHHSLLTAKQNTAVRTLETVWEPQCGETLADEPGQETFCAHLAEMSKPTGISSLDDKPSVANQLGLSNDRTWNHAHREGRQTLAQSDPFRTLQGKSLSP